MMDFQQRARLTDAEVWPVLVRQIGRLSDPADIEAVISGMTTALTRLVWSVTADPTVTQTVEVIREMACGAAVELAKASEQP